MDWHDFKVEFCAQITSIHFRRKSEHTIDCQSESTKFAVINSSNCPTNTSRCEQAKWFSASTEKYFIKASRKTKRNTFIALSFLLARYPIFSALLKMIKMNIQPSDLFWTGRFVAKGLEKHLLFRCLKDNDNTPRLILLIPDSIGKTHFESPYPHMDNNFNFQKIS